MSQTPSFDLSHAVADENFQFVAVVVTWLWNLGRRRSEPFSPCQTSNMCNEACRGKNSPRLQTRIMIAFPLIADMVAQLTAHSLEGIYTREYRTSSYVVSSTAFHVQTVQVHEVRTTSARIPGPVRTLRGRLRRYAGRLMMHTARSRVQMVGMRGKLHGFD